MLNFKEPNNRRVETQRSENSIRKFLLAVGAWREWRVSRALANQS